MSEGEKKKSRKTLILQDLSLFDLILSLRFSGERGIRTPGASQLNGFQDRRDRPLCHLSECKSRTVFRFYQIFSAFFIACRGKTLIINQKYAVLFGRLGKKINFVFDNVPPTNPYNFDRYE